MSSASQFVTGLASSGVSAADETAAAKPPSSIKDYGEPRTVPAGEFKAKCLKLLDEVAATREPLVITKFGKPVAKVVPIEEENKFDLFGAMRGSVIWEGDIISPLDVEWDAMK
jgi:prevent-host-death family protein